MLLLGTCPLPLACPQVFKNEWETYEKLNFGKPDDNVEVAGSGGGGGGFFGGVPLIYESGLLRLTPSTGNPYIVMERLGT